MEGSGVFAKSIGDGAVGSFKENFNSLSERWTRYVGDISKGILVIIVGGLVGGIVISLVSLAIGM